MLKEVDDLKNVLCYKYLGLYILNKCMIWLLGNLLRTKV